ncbi:MAG: ArsI/CadI family heavy metal resistance metalloenzyme [Burkholderiales bacterium]
MKRFHVHLSVQDLEKSIPFYSTLFGVQPAVHRPDYAKWMLEDPKVNFAISQLGHAPGLDHFGFQVESEQDLHAITGALKDANVAVFDEGETTCCYAKSEKGWVHDPQGIAWESFFTKGESTTYGVGRGEPDAGANAGSNACCGPNDAAAGSCCANGARA